MKFMEANEFIKKYGWDAAYDLWQGASPLFENNLCILSGYVCSVSESKPLFSLLDLKRLIESHDLVGRYGTVDEAKEYLPMLRMDSYDELKQAIADVESCL